MQVRKETTSLNITHRQTLWSGLGSTHHSSVIRVACWVSAFEFLIAVHLYE